MAKVLVKLQNGEETRGELLSFNQNAPTFYIHTDKDKGTTNNVMLNTADVKAIFFQKRQNGDCSIVHMETIDQSVLAGLHGFRLDVEFRDGETIHGSAHKYSPNDRGFYLVPLNPADKYERIYVNALSVKRVDSRRLMGKILVDQSKITAGQLGQALKYQQENKEKKIGTILRENNLITHEQLGESLQRQKEHGKYIGEILMEAGYITEEQLQYALLLQQENRKKKLGQILVELKFLAPNDICIALATQLSLPWADLSSVEILPGTATALPEDVVRRLCALPIEQRDDRLIIASAEPQAPGLKGEISRYTELEVELAVAFDGYIESVINHFFPPQSKAA
ncbi:MAG: hypothetical protein HZA17_09850 [Nitrospirae bacterium]|nr:hypothetical protein [Nitrospirota bacterium]